MENFRIYHEGRYDLKKNLQFRVYRKADELKVQITLRCEAIDYYFVNHKKLVR